MRKLYNFRKSRRILKHGCSLYRKKKKRLLESERLFFESILKKLDQALLDKNREEANAHAHEVETFVKKHFPKNIFDHLKELIFALVFAIVIAFVIRQVWFELYEVPTGSMRPTIEELDRMVVSKTTFGIHLPFQKNILFYNPKYIQRNGIIVFTVADMDVADADTVYFYVFPGKKRYIKRCLAKPGDTVYFYGGRLYAIDSDGKPITEMSDEAYLQKIGIDRIDHIPFITFDGKTKLVSPLTRGLYSSSTIYQMNQPIGKLNMKKNRSVEGRFFNGEKWVKDNIAALKSPHTTVESYSDLWGISNYAMARLLNREELLTLYDKQFPTTDKALAYLELRHTPNLTYPLPQLRQGDRGKIHPMITPFVAIIPLNQEHLNAIQKNLFTSRFFMQDGHAYRYQEKKTRPQRPEFDPIFPNVPDGCYEFYYGKGYKVHMGGIMTKLPKNHPLYSSKPENIKKLFNLGIGFNLVFQPVVANQPYNPQRFAYYRNGELYLMGAPILKKEDAVLKQFVSKELEKQKASSAEKPYIAFIDHGPPLKEGIIDVEFIRTFGLKIPEEGILALGDNYSMSADSRDFGFVPTQNLRGSPSFIFWPPSKRLGPLPQPSYRWFTLPNCLIWGLFVIIVIVCVVYFKIRNNKPYFKL